MKGTKDLVGRAVVLLLISDRCALEKEVIGGKRYTLEERENQRLLLDKWLNNNGYNKYRTQKEKDLFEKNITHSKELVDYQVIHEALEPILWVLGYIDKLSSYSTFVTKDFHPYLEIGRGHSFEKLVNKACLVSKNKIELQKEIAFLWHWRTRAGMNTIFSQKDAKEIINETFGHMFENVLGRIEFDTKSPKDFSVNSIPFYKLNTDQIKAYEMLSLWRHHSFEWILSNDEWDEVDTST